MLVHPHEIMLGSLRSLAINAGVDPNVVFSPDTGQEFRALPGDTQRGLVASTVCGTGLPSGFTSAQVVACLRECAVDEAEALADACAAVENAKQVGEVALLVSAGGWSEARATAAYAAAVAFGEAAGSLSEQVVDPLDVVEASFGTSLGPLMRESYKELPLDVQRVLVLVAVIRAGIPSGMTPEHVVSALRGCSVGAAEEFEDACLIVQVGDVLNSPQGRDTSVKIDHPRMIASACGWTEVRAKAALAEAERLGLIGLPSSPPARTRAPRPFVKPRSKKDRKR